eukprot:CAMPEP_0116996100 /NCGR_PEP_ID=MMETSP0472-20121206/33_1 /TAXON_ID=693140 ORGANISM="Tiarina fusus, Strain LIS" /NCGR_SAMPLE_ID=MMETSP0472 /ASSEMBLY_ACC=CAM_ASM_000603 /LENGTH=196 /DNA_ID=CAMNT_0004694637 /DNA_START=821 /DNA_END=1411 /DNA_ORIENTATION=-
MNVTEVNEETVFNESRGGLGNESAYFLTYVHPDYHTGLPSVTTESRLISPIVHVNIAADNDYLEEEIRSWDSGVRNGNENLPPLGSLALVEYNSGLRSAQNNIPHSISTHSAYEPSASSMYLPYDDSDSVSMAPNASYNAEIHRNDPAGAVRENISNNIYDYHQFDAGARLLNLILILMMKLKKFMGLQLRFLGWI